MRLEVKVELSSVLFESWVVALEELFARVSVETVKERRVKDKELCMLPRQHLKHKEKRKMMQVATRKNPRRSGKCLPDLATLFEAIAGSAVMCS